MINKEIILNVDGSIKRDFIDRNIPQNSNNQVSVNVLIPSACFTGLSNYAVILGVARKLNGENTYTTLNSLVMTASKSITIEGVLYIKYSAILSISYTNKIGILQLSPYIQTTATTTINNVATEVIILQQAFTNSQLNVIKSVLPQYDASLEEGTIATTLAGQIALKKIYTFVDTDSASLGEHYYNLANSYDPNASQFEGCLVISIYDGETRQYMPYINNSDVELLEITKDGKFYRISGVDYDSGTTTYTYTRTQLSYDKSEIDTKETNLQTQINAKVDKTQKVNGHALSGDITITKSDVGLGNVANYGVESVEPDASGSQLYITSKAVYDALQLVYAVFNDFTTLTDFNALTNRVEAIETLIGDNDGDDDNIINTLKEVIATLSGLGEDANILSMINSKASQSDFTALNTQINGTGGIADKVEILSERDNAYMEIATFNITTSEWVSNADANYPYKYELTNGYLIGATNAILVFSKDSDTSMLSATVGIDDTNGKLIIYASAQPTQTIVVEKIAIFNDVNAYINYSNQVVQDVNTLKTQVNEINNNKIPNKLDAVVENPNDSDDNSTISNHYTGVRIEVKENDKQVAFFNVGQAGSYMSYTESDEEQGIGLDHDGFKILTQSGNDIHELAFDRNGNLTIDGVAVGGGGSQLYQHNVIIYSSNMNQKLCFSITNDSNTSFTIDTLFDYLYDKGFIIDSNLAYDFQKNICLCSGWANDGSNNGLVWGCGVNATKTSLMVYGFRSTSKWTTGIDKTNFSGIEDTKYAL